MMKRILSKLFTLILILAITFTLSITALAADLTSFPDVKPADWYYENVTKLVATGTIVGCPDGTFKPNDPITRAEFTKILVSALNLELKHGNVFNDTVESWASPYISTAVAEGIIYKFEYQEGFKPASQITRLEMARMLVRALDISEATDSFPFADTSDAYASTAYESYLIEGNPSGPYLMFRPDDGATRAEACTLAVRAIRYKADAAGYIQTASEARLQILQNTSPEQVDSGSIGNALDRFDRVIYEDEEYIEDLVVLTEEMARNVPESVIQIFNDDGWTLIFSHSWKKYGCKPPTAFSMNAGYAMFYGIGNEKNKLVLFPADRINDKNVKYGESYFTTLYHELGHVVSFHYRMDRNGVQDEIWNAEAQTISELTTKYALSSDYESWAEAFRYLMKHMNNSTLMAEAKQKIPIAYSYFDAIINGQYASKYGKVA